MARRTATAKEVPVWLKKAGLDDSELIEKKLAHVRAQRMVNDAEIGFLEHALRIVDKVMANSKEPK